MVARLVFVLGLLVYQREFVALLGREFGGLY
jgi:hypothetical protein